MFKENSNLLHIGNKPISEVLNPESMPIYNSVAYEIQDTTDYEYATNGNKYYYNRTGNPNRDAFAEAVSYLENSEETLICSSGMGAISSTLIGLFKAGDHGLFSADIYGETISLVEILRKYGVEITFADFTDIESVKNSVKENTKIFYTEIISNPHTKIVDIREISKIAKENDAYVVVDSTFTTPFVMKPLNFGADVVVHSLTKFFGGHGDLCGGSISASKEIIDKIRSTYVLLGATLDSNSCWLFQRSVKTMSMRIKTQQENAIKIAKALSEIPCIKKVYHPSLESHPQHKIAGEMFTNTYGSMISFLVDDDRAKVDEFIRSLNLVKYLGTLGGMGTSFAHPLSSFRGSFTAEELANMGLTEGLLRISVGVEDADDIIEDLKTALKVFE